VVFVAGVRVVEFVPKRLVTFCKCYLSLFIIAYFSPLSFRLIVFAERLQLRRLFIRAISLLPPAKKVYIFTSAYLFVCLSARSSFTQKFMNGFCRNFWKSRA